jgi:hypothetical protein
MWGTEAGAASSCLARVGALEVQLAGVTSPGALPARVAALERLSGV